MSQITLKEFERYDVDVSHLIEWCGAVDEKGVVCGCNTFHTFKGEEPWFYCDRCGADYVAG
jgi:hypothetical protein